MGQGYGLHLVGDRHLEVQRSATLAGDHRQALDVAVGDVPAILPQVRGDAVGAVGHGQFGRPHRVRIVGAPGVPDGRHVVDIDAQSQPGHARSLFEPGSSAGRAASSGGISFSA